MGKGSSLLGVDSFTGFSDANDQISLSDNVASPSDSFVGFPSAFGSELPAGATVTAIFYAKNSFLNSYDPELSIYSSGGGGRLLGRNDDTGDSSLGSGLNSRVTFTNPADGLGFIGVVRVVSPTIPRQLGEERRFDVGYFEYNWDEAGNSIDTARNLGFLLGNSSYADFVGLSDQSDYYSLNIDGKSTLSAELSSGRYANLEILNYAGSRVVDGFVDMPGTSTKSLNLNLDAGTYYVRVGVNPQTLTNALGGNNTTTVITALNQVKADYTLNLSVAPLPSIQFSQSTPYQSSEGVGNSSVVTLTRTRNTASTSQVKVNITGGTAIAGTDYTSTGFPLTVNFAAGETSKTVAIPIAQDTLVEGTETITFSVTGLSNAAIGATSTATLQILDDDQPAPFTGTSGNDRLNGDALNNTIDGKEGNDTINGFGGDDILIGGFGNDSLFGGLGNDTLQGGDGDDTLFGLYGFDVITGGPGRDQFAFNIANTVFNRSFAGITSITDFTRGEDKIVLGQQTFSKLSRGLTFASVKNTQQAQKSKALITYVSRSGSLFYNANGARAGFGEGGQFADLTDGLTLAKSDIVLV